LLPSFILVTLPVALVLATMFALNKMTNDRELIVMRSTGLSDLGIGGPIAVLGLVAVGIGYFLSLYLLPVSFRHFKDLQVEIRENFSAGLVQEGAFTNLGRNLTIYVRDRVGDDVYGILVQDNRQSGKQYTMMAERGLITTGPNGPRVIMFDGNRQELDRKTGKLSLLYFKSYSFDFGAPKRHKRIWHEPNERFLPSLLDPGNSAHDRYYRKKLIASGHNRIVTPLFGLTMPLIALAAMLLGQFNKRGQAVRIVIGITAAAAVQGAAMALYSSSAKMLELVPLVYLNGIGPGVAAFYLLARRPRFRFSLPFLAKPRPT
jgi:lipopolysaccharide export system permease protein